MEKLIKEAHETAVEKGWWNEERSLGNQFANFHAEISEAWEEYRSGNGITEIYLEGDKPCGLPTELADVLIRIFDTCAQYDIPIIHALQVKMAYNKTRPYRHGGKLA